MASCGCGCRGRFFSHTPVVVLSALVVLLVRTSSTCSSSTTCTSTSTSSTRTSTTANTSSTSSTSANGTPHFQSPRCWPDEVLDPVAFPAQTLHAELPFASSQKLQGFLELCSAGREPLEVMEQILVAVDVLCYIRQMLVQITSAPATGHGICRSTNIGFFWVVILREFLCESHDRGRRVRGDAVVVRIHAMPPRPVALRSG